MEPGRSHHVAILAAFAHSAGAGPTAELLYAYVEKVKGGVSWEFPVVALQVGGRSGGRLGREGNPAVHSMGGVVSTGLLRQDKQAPQGQLVVSNRSHLKIHSGGGQGPSSSGCFGQLIKSA